MVMFTIYITTYECLYSIAHYNISPKFLYSIFFSYTCGFLTTQTLDGNILCGYCSIFTLKQENDEKGIPSRSLHRRMSDRAGLVWQEVARYDASAYSL